jgi:hypothetical protein
MDTDAFLRRERSLTARPVRVEFAISLYQLTAVEPVAKGFSGCLRCRICHCNSGPGKICVPFASGVVEWGVVA